MLNNTIKKYSLDTYLLCTPYEHKFHRDFDGDLLEEDFQNQLYVEPYLERELEEINAEIKKVQETANFENNYKLIDELNDDKEELFEKRRSIERALENKNRVEHIINNITAGDIVYIRGSSGCGKSTYLNRLIYQLKNKGIKCFNFNLEDSTSFPHLLNQRWQNSQYSDCAFAHTDFKLISVILHQMDFLLNKYELSKIHKWESEQVESKYKSYLTKLNDNLFTFFLERSPDRFEKFICIYKTISEYLKGNLAYSTEFNKYTQERVDSFSKKMSACIFNECDKAIKDIDSRENFTSNGIFNTLLTMFFILAICTLDSGDIEENKYKFVIAFDNIEHYIKNDVVYDRDIYKITKIISDYIEFANNELFRDTILEYSGHFQFILSIRDTTENFIYKVAHQDDFPNCTIDLTSWYYLSDLHESRYSFLSELEVFDADYKRVYKTIQHILNDVTVYNNSTGKALERMFNYNKRRITMYLCEVLSSNQEYIDEYESLWEKAQNNELSASCYKNAARSYITRILLDQIQDTNYFLDLQVVGKDGKEGSGYARRLITYLYNCRLDGNDDYVGFYDLVKYVLESPCNKNIIEYSECFLLAQIIIKMRDPQISSTKWCQLVLLRFNQKNVDVKVLAEKLLDSYRNKDNMPGTYGIKITQAGCYYTEILPHFEYFSTRYCRGTRPLFSEYNLSKKSTNTNLTGIEGQEELAFQCYNLIKEVKEHAMKCIDNIVKFEISFFSGRKRFNPMAMENGGYLWRKNYAYRTKRMCHPRRIIDHHISYLDNFRIYILEYNSDEENGIFSNEDKIVLVKYVLRTINEYIQKLKQLSTEDKNGVVYLNLSETVVEKYEGAYFREWKRIEKGDLTYSRIMN